LVVSGPGSQTQGFIYLSPGFSLPSDPVVYTLHLHVTSADLSVDGVYLDVVELTNSFSFYQVTWNERVLGSFAWAVPGAYGFPDDYIQTVASSFFVPSGTTAGDDIAIPFSVGTFNSFYALSLAVRVSDGSPDGAVHFSGSDTDGCPFITYVVSPTPTPTITPTEMPTETPTETSTPPPCTTDEFSYSVVLTSNNCMRVIRQISFGEIITSSALFMLLALGLMYFIWKLVTRWI
jgi:hypothetical protein